MQSSTHQSPSNPIAVEGGIQPPMGRPYKQRQQSHLSVQYTLRLSPGSGAEKWSKEWQWSINCHYQGIKPQAWNMSPSIFSNPQPSPLYFTTLTQKNTKGQMECFCLTGLYSLRLKTVRKMQTHRHEKTHFFPLPHPLQAKSGRGIGTTQTECFSQRLLATERQTLEHLGQDSHLLLCPIMGVVP